MAAVPAARTTAADPAADSAADVAAGPATPQRSAAAGRPTATSRRPPAATAVLAALAGMAAMALVGGSVAVSGELSGAPLLTSQALRYAVACLLLLALARACRRRVPRPRGREWLWLLGVVATGLVLFNVALVRGAAHAEPAVLGVAVAAVPVLLAALGPLLEGHRPGPPVLAAALLVTCGAVLVQGTGRSDAAGLAWAIVVLCCEAGFTLLAVPILRSLGPWGVSVHTTWLAAGVLAVLGAAAEGPAAATRLDVHELLALGYLAVAVTAVAFVLWYSSVGRLGAGRAGLLTGVAPVAAAASGVALGAPLPAPPVWLGVAVVALGLALGLPASAVATRRAPTAAADTAPPASAVAPPGLRHRRSPTARFRARRERTSPPGTPGCPGSPAAEELR